MTTLLTVADVASRLSISVRTVRAMIDRGDLRVVELGSGRRLTLRVRGEDVDQYIERRTKRRGLTGKDFRKVEAWA